MEDKQARTTGSFRRFFTTFSRRATAMGLRLRDSSHSLKTAGGWLGPMQNYFLTVWFVSCSQSTRMWGAPSLTEVSLAVQHSPLLKPLGPLLQLRPQQPLSTSLSGVAS